MSDINKDQVIDFLSSLTVLQLKEIIEELEEKWGVSAASAVAVAAAPAAGGGAEAAVEEKTEFDVILASAGEKKINVIKVLRQVNPALGLKEAKEVADSTPKAIKEAVSKAEAEDIKAKIEEAGGKVEIK